MQKNFEGIPEDLLSSLSQKLADQMGLYFSRENWKDMLRKLTPSAEHFGFSHLNPYLTWLVERPFNQELIQTLAGYLTIGETYFFRDDRTFRTLKEKILPELIYKKNQKNQKQLKIWCAGCSTGEEPYSIAILLNTLILDLNSWNITLFASDINADFLAKAKKGIYKEWSFRATPPEIRNAYFTKHSDGSYEINAHIKKRVCWIYLNLVEDNYPSQTQNLSDIDILLCNNVLIYFSPEQIHAVIHKFSKTLAPSGWLIVTPIEVPYVVDSALQTVRYEGTTFFKKETNLPTPFPASLPMESPALTPMPPPISPLSKQTPFKIELPAFLNPTQPFLEINPYAPPTRSHLLVQEELNVKHEDTLEEEISIEKQAFALYRQGLYKEALDLLNGFIEKHQEESKAERILAIKCYTNLGLYNDANRLCQEALASDKLNPSLQYVHATVLQEKNQLEEAVESLKRALYLDSNFIMAHFHLGLILLRQGRHTAASRHLRNAWDLLQNVPPQARLPEGEDLTSDQLRDMIKGTLEQLKRSS